MEPLEVVAAMNAFRQSTGGNAKRVYIGFRDETWGTNPKPVYASVHSDRPTSDPGWMNKRSEQSVLHVEASTWAELFEALPTKWRERQVELNADLIHQMALAVISLTEKFGECMDGALRGDGFSNDEVAEFGERACDKAGKMAANGPFAISRGGNPNSR
jgi:hypothetical protein